MPGLLDRAAGTPDPANVGILQDPGILRRVMDWLGVGAQAGLESYADALTNTNRGAVLPIERDPRTGAYSPAFPRLLDVWNTLPSPAKAGSVVLGAGGAMPKAVAGALDLSTEARMTRAARQGYTTPVYHGSRGPEATWLEPFPHLRPIGGGGSKGDFGVHLALDPETAHSAIAPEFARKHYGQQIATGSPPEAAAARRELEGFYEPEAKTYPLLANLGKSVTLPDFGRWDTPSNAESKFFERKTDYGDVIDRYKESSGWEHTDYGTKYEPSEKMLAATDDPEFVRDLGQLMSRIDRKGKLESKAFRKLQSQGYPDAKDFMKPDGEVDYPAFEAARKKWSEEVYAPYLAKHPRMSENQEWQKGFVKLMKKHGYDSVAYRNEIEGKGELSFFVVDPAKVRSVHAKFDPARAGDPDILAARAAPGQLGSLTQSAIEASPPSGILDLSTEARMARAAEQGFDTSRPVYHGTPSGGFDKFSSEVRGMNTGHAPEEVGYHFSDNPDFAEAYSRAHDVSFYDTAEKALGYAPKAITLPAGAQIMPVYLRGKKWFDVPLSKDIDVNTIAKAQAAGFDGIRASHGNGTEFVIFDPANIRSVHAKFDPASASSADILAAQAPVPGGILDLPQPPGSYEDYLRRGGA